MAVDGPRSEAVARRLGCDKDQLETFVVQHPEPDASAVLTFADASAEHSELVDAWLEAFLKRRQRRLEEKYGDFNGGDVRDLR